MWLLETCKAHMWLVCVAGSEFQFERPVWSLEWERGSSAALPVWTLPSPVSAAATSIQVSMWDDIHACLNLQMTASL